jgi:hypothetical protein
MQLRSTIRGAFLAVTFSASALAAQPVRISGTVVDERSQPVAGATLRLTGADSAVTTPANGTFLFEGIFPNGMILTVTAPGYEFRSIPLSPGNTALTVTLKSRITNLDPMIVRPKAFRVKGQVVDARSGDALLFARVTLYPDNRARDANDVGDFRFDSAGAGTMTIIAEAMEHLPVAIQFTATRDTSLGKIRMPIDSVAMRMMNQQVERLKKRSQGSEFPVRYADRTDIAREARSAISEMVEALLVRRLDRRTTMRQSASESCVFYDDRKIAPGMLFGIYPELIERVEVFHRGGMIRIYSKRYVMSLMGQEMLRKPVYIVTPGGIFCE